MKLSHYEIVTYHRSGRMDTSDVTYTLRAPAIEDAHTAWRTRAPGVVSVMVFAVSSEMDTHFRDTPARETIFDFTCPDWAHEMSPEGRRA